MSDIKKSALQPASKATFNPKVSKKIKEELAQQPIYVDKINLPNTGIPAQPYIQASTMMGQPPVISENATLTQPLLPGERIIGEAERIVGTDTLLPPGGHTNLFPSRNIGSYEAQTVGKLLDASIMTDLQNKVNQSHSHLQPTVKQGISGAFQTLANVLPQNANVIAGQLDTNLNQGLLHSQTSAPIQTHMPQNFIAEHLPGTLLQNNFPQMTKEELITQQNALSGGISQQHLLGTQNVSLQHQIANEGLQQQGGLPSPIINPLQQQAANLLHQPQHQDPAWGQQLPIPGATNFSSSSQFPGTGLHADSAVRQQVLNREGVLEQDLTNLQANANKHII